MKTSFVLGFAGLAAAQSISSLVGMLPSCATGPLIAAIQKSGCGVTDYSCQCQASNKAKIQTAATPGITAACSGAEISQVLSITSQICQIALSSSGSSAASSAAATSAAATSAAASSAAATYAASSAAASTPAATSAAAVSQISDGQPQATSPVAAISQISDGQPQASAPVSPLYTGAAAKVAGPVGGAVLLAAAAFAL